ncbi:MAG: DUF1761 domain-containing protein [Bacteroidota bacterium]
MEMNILAIVVAAIVPLIVGAIWYNPKVLGTAWMKASGMTEEKMKGGNIAVIFGITLVLSILLAMTVNGMVIHQIAASQMVYPNMEAETYKAFMAEFGNAHRNFRHGALHGAIGALFFVLPVLGINALFERKGWKYILVNVGYWVVTLAIMGAILCGWK